METLSVHDIKELMHAKHITSAEVSEWLASVEEFAETIRNPLASFPHGHAKGGRGDA